MGEYAKYMGQEIKIGTCEDMYYLRYDQRHSVSAITGSVDPRGPQALGIRFRFPWPDEDHIHPGSFDAYNRALTIYGLDMPEGVDHYRVQFRADAGYLVSIPCPEGKDHSHGLKIARNGFAGAVRLVQQKLLANGRVVPVLQCGGCGAAWRVEEPEEIIQIADAARKMGEKQCSFGAPFWAKVADRILASAQIELATS